MRIEVENDQIRERKKQEYEDLVKEMGEKGYAPKLEKISVVWANVFAMILFILVAIPTIIAFVWWNGKENFNGEKICWGLNSSVWLLILFAIYLVTIFIHEFIHGFFWHFPCEKKWGSIDFGFNPKVVTPYCHCCEALSIPQYFWGCIAPTVILGVIPTIVGVLVGEFSVAMLGVIGICGGGGDILVVWTLRKHKNCKLFDHPYEVGYAYFVKKTDESAES